MNRCAKLVTRGLAVVAVVAVVTVGCASLAPERTPDPSRVPGLPKIVVTEATVPSRLTVYRTLHGVEALRASGVVPADVAGFVDAIETSFDGDEEHVGDHQDLYRTFGAVFDTVGDAERAFAAAVVLHEADDWWGLSSDRAPLERETDVGLGDESVHYTQGSDYGRPEISVYFWRVGNVLLHAVDFHPYDRRDLLESMVREMDARASGDALPGP
jgi:hypothetical protein